MTISDPPSIDAILRTLTEAVDRLGQRVDTNAVIMNDARDALHARLDKLEAMSVGSQPIQEAAHERDARVVSAASACAPTTPLARSCAENPTLAATLICATARDRDAQWAARRRAEVQRDEAKRALNDRCVSLDADKTTLKGQRDEAEGQRDSAQRERDALRLRVEALLMDGGAMRKRLDVLSADNVELLRRLDAINAKLRAALGADPIKVLDVLGALPRRD